MGQKVHPVGIRLGITSEYDASWYTNNKSDFAAMLNADISVRKMLKDRYKGAAISRITIDRPAKNARVVIYSARPGVIIGKKGGEVETLRDDIAKVLKVPVHLSIEEIKKPELTAILVAENIAQQLERRVMFRRAMKRAVQTTMRLGALGIKVAVAGRLGGAEIARTEWYKEGRIPLHTFRAEIDYGVAEARTTYGVIGIKVWIYKGDALLRQAAQEEKQ